MMVVPSIVLPEAAEGKGYFLERISRDFGETS